MIPPGARAAGSRPAAAAAGVAWLAAGSLAVYLPARPAAVPVAGTFTWLALAVLAAWLGNRWWAGAAGGVALAVLRGGAGHWTPAAWAAGLLALPALTVTAAVLRAPRTGGPGPWEAVLPPALLLDLGLALALAAPLGPRPPGPLALGLLYALTPVAEAGFGAMVLARHQGLGDFLRTGYRLQPAGPLIRAGVWNGLGVLALTAGLTALEEAWHRFRVVSDNPFVYERSLGSHPVATILVALAAVVGAPLAEEALFRGILYGVWREYFPRPVASAAAAAVFALMHRNLSLLVPLWAAGWWFNRLYERSRSLIPSTVAHATLNGVAVLLALGAMGRL
ncbi:conserved membrane protein of unknown function [Candidatus Hydrogenisulfobacillus filiaventi]|uniref:CAAX prenyl protease 2/Lysostaphin resistance protein A-like domain-containing protein n=1 Tax=Candidatus Hydrogenisulfobacillus filiaventi TaxID=2707344 RepID=A0A6F8ZGE3_9FIRM|nr:conserved membrane protein of unknown function [Candidatus Hydrogenisulfobacillus filiaventi]